MKAAFLLNWLRAAWSAALISVIGLAPACGDEPILATAIDFERQVQPLLESACLNCHGAAKAEGGLRLDSREFALRGGASGPALVPGKPDESPLYTTTLLAADEPQVMPPVGGRLDRSQTAVLQRWIAAGAPWPADAKLATQPRIDFVKHVQPVLERHCLACHSSNRPQGELNLSTRQSAFAGGAGGLSIQPYRPAASPLYTLTVAAADDEQLMPPKRQGGPLAKEATEPLRLWIAQGAVWPDDAQLTPRASAGPNSPDNFELINKLHAAIVKQSAESPAEWKDYEGEIPRTKAKYAMVAIPGGDFLMGSPEGEPHRGPNEGPQTQVKVAPFWMGKFEVTWDEYEPFMITRVDREKNGARKNYDPQVHSIVDAVSQPTPPYVEMSFGMGQRGFPACSMTQHAANKYCQWLSAQTGHFYRLPTEAEWEYACRAGTTTAYSFGDDPEQLSQYAWHYDNSNEKYQRVGQKKPNPWGLHDMHGNVMEWTADQYAPDYFQRIQNRADNPLVRPETLYPRTVRGGGWDDDPERLRSASRRGSEPAWKQQDPQLPKSIWYHTNAPWLGFRIVRPQKIPTVDEMDFAWNSATGSR